jgi:hypothetical protein
MFGKVKRKLNIFNTLTHQIQQVSDRISSVQESLGRIESRQIQHSQTIDRLTDSEFKVFSQWGEDGIIQYLIRETSIKSHIFVEFGVENYTESNTRFLLINNNWSGLIIDGSSENITHIKNQPIYWQRNLKAVDRFITTENINDILKSNGVSGEIGLLSVDVDGNDYWIWKAIDCISPAIVICEYNSRFGYEQAVTIPYNPDFIRSVAHHSMIYYGASLKALNLLAEEKGYAFVGCNSAGNNAFFIRKDLKPDSIREVSVREGFICGEYRESRYPDGSLAFLSHDEETAILATLPLVKI